MKNPFTWVHEFFSKRRSTQKDTQGGRNGLQSLSFPDVSRSFTLSPMGESKPIEIRVEIIVKGEDR